MRPEYYADVYRRYQTFCRTYGERRPYKIACGASDFNYSWTETLMKQAASFMDGISLHYYTVCGDTWEHKGSATDFTLEEYYKTLGKAARMDELLRGHEAVMDRYDPKKRIGLIVDEWGTWFDVEPGTNPGFLYQQNTMRDALVAAVTLNIFNRHCDRVVMANIAQMVNVLQAILLTEGDQLVLTPTYHVFDLFQAHQGAREIDCFQQADRVGTDDWCMEQISSSASEKNGVTTVTLANLSADQAAEVRVLGLSAEKAEARVLSGEMHEKNDFGKADLAPRSLPVQRTAESWLLTLPACSVAELTLA